jgi:Family of unknown function (DUF5320)
MPRGDRTGPMGMGPMTGRGGGYCAGSGMSGFNQSGGSGFFGRGLSRALGWGAGGRGFCRWFFAAGLPAWQRFAGGRASFEGSDPDLGKQSLKAQAEALQSELDRIKKRLQEMEAGSASE